MPASQPPIYVVKAEVFRAIGHPARVRILELLRDGERNVGELQGALNLDSSGTSQHLAALRKVGLVETRRAGTSVYYRLRNRKIVRLLEVARQILLENLTDDQGLIADLAREARERAGAGGQAGVSRRRRKSASAA